MGSLNLLVVGQCGDGKSTLIKHFAKGDKKPVEGKDPKGVTKTIDCYDAGTIGGRAVKLLDSPGVGDKHITVSKLVVMIETFLENGGPGSTINGVLMCSSVGQNRVTLGAKVVGAMADKGFVGESKWGEFIFVGTQADRCDTEEIDNFKTATLAELNDCCNGAIDKVAVIKLNHKKEDGVDVSELEALIAKLPGNPIEYKAPDMTEFAERIGEIMDIPPKVIEQEVIVYRESAKTNFLEELGKGLATGLTLGALQWHGDTPVFGWQK